jgi:NDP-sugar pyrophosphorylase family protein
MFEFIEKLLNKKYTLSETVKVGQKEFYRIKAIKSFGNIAEGEYGGLVESEDNLSHDGNCWIYRGAMASDNSRVRDNAQLKDFSAISGNALIEGKAIISGFSEVTQSAVIRDNSKVYDVSLISGNSLICGSAIITGKTVIHNNCVSNNYVTNEMRLKHV